ncbi:M15 family metallopeptidase [Paraglaciecola aquimarina]|uniref:M15 family metallopeptidase n=1 Tax=Paraglaciecola aquimarina TaxID=1235557 RepID=A0ABU3SZP9_9ALTE|nr:M15 family metallopeptidase [Paraglaciecola aquimarina]MDU0355489.1 M15 family metallopeptidase [Paraglaciecola aquimarina]
MITSSHILGQDDSLLVDCQHGFKLLPEVCDAFKNMQQRAIKDGIDLQIVSSHRGYERQLGIWQNKWSGKTAVLDINETPIDTSQLSALDKAFSILTWSALPGASRHHWGTDLDVYDKNAVLDSGQKFQLVCSEYASNGPCHALNMWLQENAHSYLFSRPYHVFKGGIAQEPWHLSYVPTASQFEQLLDQETLRKAILNSNMLGADTILANLDVIFNRFILNKGKL